MSPINFATLRDDYPEYGAVWPQLKTWFEKNRRKQYVELSVLLRALRDVQKMDVIMALHAMIHEGMLTTAYKFRAPDGDLLEGEFEEPDQIPKELPSRDYSHFVPTDSGDIVSGYKWDPALAS